MPVASHAATLDTGLVASGYPGGIPTRWSSTHFQYARASLGSLMLLFSSEYESRPGIIVGKLFLIKPQ